MQPRRSLVKFPRSPCIIVICDVLLLLVINYSSPRLYQRSSMFGCSCAARSESISSQFPRALSLMYLFNRAVPGEHRKKFRRTRFIRNSDHGLRSALLRISLLMRQVVNITFCFVIFEFYVIDFFHGSRRLKASLKRCSRPASASPSAGRVKRLQLPSIHVLGCW